MAHSSEEHRQRQQPHHNSIIAPPTQPKHASFKQMATTNEHDRLCQHSTCQHITRSSEAHLQVTTAAAVEGTCTANGDHRETADSEALHSSAQHC
jgi:hypothetical protein